MSVIVDLQGFKTDDNKFIVKEIALLSNYIQTYLIKPPFSYYLLTENEKKQVRWIQHNRQVYWDDGVVKYTDCRKFLYKLLQDKKIYVKGAEKILWVERNNRVRKYRRS